MRYTETGIWVVLIILQIGALWFLEAFVRDLWRVFVNWVARRHYKAPKGSKRASKGSRRHEEGLRAP
jgi:hypothetical protein